MMLFYSFSAQLKNKMNTLYHLQCIYRLTNTHELNSNFRVILGNNIFNIKRIVLLNTSERTTLLRQSYRTTNITHWKFEENEK